MASKDLNQKLHAVANRIWLLREQMQRVAQQRLKLLKAIKQQQAIGVAAGTEASYERRLNFLRMEYRLNDDHLSALSADEQSLMRTYEKMVKSA